ncbi:MAG: hypothetical protein AAF889_00090 [Cyanobacteria bacterium P01_D01_bin.73]
MSDLISIFGDEFGDILFLVASHEIRKFIHVSEALRDIVEVTEIEWIDFQSRRKIADQILSLKQDGRYCSVLIISEDDYSHFDEIEILNAKIAAISFFSTSFSLQALSRTAEIIKNTNYALQLKTELALVERLDEADVTIFRDEDYGTESVFQHHESDNWFSLHGPLSFGQQAVLPTGELSVLTDESGQFSDQSKFRLDGKLLVKGVPIIHRSDFNVSLKETIETYDKLSSMKTESIIFNVKDGEIVSIADASMRNTSLLQEFEELLSSDSRYCKIHEIGFGSNPNCADLFDENYFPNERFPGVHFGLGLGSFTKYHIDLVCENTKVFIGSGNSYELREVYDTAALQFRENSSLY